MQFPKKKWVENKPAGVKSEASLQSFTDDYLAVLHIDNYRITDQMWAGLNMLGRTSAQAAGIVMAWKKTFGGKLPDNLLYRRYGEQFCLMMPLELKSATGKLHGKQKTEAKETGWTVCRTPEEVIAAVESFTREWKSLVDKAGKT